MGGRSETFRTVVLAVLGFLILVTPLALWVAWSQTVFVVVLGGGGASALSYCVLARRWEKGFPQRRLAELSSAGADDAAAAPESARQPSRTRLLLGDPVVWIGVVALVVVWWLART
jgi:hypothetical protein